MKLFNWIVLVLSLFLKKLKNLLHLKTSRQHFARTKKQFSYSCIGFIDFMLAGKKLTDFTNMFSPQDFQKNDDIILSYFKDG